MSDFLNSFLDPTPPAFSMTSPDTLPNPKPSQTPRLLTALIGIPIVLIVVYIGGAAFRLLCLALSLGALRELQIALRESRQMGGAQLIGAVAYPAVLWAVWRGVGPGLALITMGFLLALCVLISGREARLNLPSVAITLLATLYVALFALLPILRGGGSGEIFVLLLFGVWASDTAAYYGGRAFGKTRLSPLSPGKTREGALCGVFAATMVSVLVATWAGFPLSQGVILGLIVAVCAPLGDLVESFWKRELGVKDLGTLLPGHGGILDRCDSLLFAALGLQIYFLLLAG